MTNPEDESLADWAARRERDRAEQRRKLGTRRVVPLSDGGGASHIAPDAPRLLLEWNGTGWTTCGVAANANAAREFLGRVPEHETVQDAPPAWPGLGPGPGRHRKP